MRGRSYYAGLALRNHFTQLSSIKLSDKGNCWGAIWPQTYNEPWQYKNANQKPHLFYLPALKAQPFWPNSNFNWTDEFLIRFDELQGEFSEIIEVVQSRNASFLEYNLAITCHDFTWYGCNCLICVTIFKCKNLFYSIVSKLFVF